MNEYKSIKDFLNEIEADFRTHAPRNSGKLASSIQADLIMKQDGFIIDIEMEQYGWFQDQGVNGIYKRYGSPYSFKGKQPPISAFSGYGLTLGQKYAASRSVYEKGIKPKHFIEPAFNRAMDKLGNIAIEDIEDYIDKKWKNK
jgi:hypothetical protein